MSIRRHTWEYYKTVVGKCSNPECEAYSELEAHHIVPLYADGDDMFDNIIILCEQCHRFDHNHFHSDWAAYYDTLHKWKYNIDTRCKFSKRSGYVATRMSTIGLPPTNNTKHVDPPHIKDVFAKIEMCDRPHIIPAKGITTIQALANMIQVRPSIVLKALEKHGITYLNFGKEYDQKVISLESVVVREDRVANA